MLSDLRFAWRLLWRNPGFAAVSWLTLAAGIASTTVIYAVLHSILLRPLPVRDQSTVVVAYATRQEVSDANPVSHPKFEEWRASGVFETMVAFAPFSRRIDLTDGPAERLNVAGVSLEFFDALGARAAVGRTLGPADAGSDLIPAVISHALWRRRYDSDPEIVGRVIGAGENAMSVVGVMPPGFHRWRRETHIWAPIDRVQPPKILSSRGYMIVYPVGRLRPGMSTEQARERLDVVDRRSEERVRASANARRDGVRLVALHDDIVSAPVAQILVVLIVAVGLMWLVVCANQSMLLLARGAGRAGELALRLAVGADRRRLVRQLLVESAVLAIPGGVIGAAVAWWGVRALAVLGPAPMLTTDIVWVDATVLTFTAGLTIASVFVFGLVPAVRVSNVTLYAAAQAHRVRRTSRLSRGVLVAQIAVAVVVLAGSALLARSALEMQRVDLGFDPSRVLTMGVHLPTSRYGAADGIEDARYVPAQRELLARLGRLPGVEAVSFGGGIFVPEVDYRASISLEDGRRFLNGDPENRRFVPLLNFVGPDFFRVHGVTVLRGRELTAADDFSAPRVVIINETLEQLLWPGEGALGKRVNFGVFRPGRGYSEPWAEVIGIVADVRHGGVHMPVRPAVFRSALQYPRQEFEMMLRGSVAPETLAPLVRREVRAFDPDVIVYRERGLADVVAEATAPMRHSSAALSLFAGLTSALCGFGVFSLLSFAVAARRRELGVRIALGAAPLRIARDVARETAWMLVPGLATGLAASWLSLRFLGALLFGVSPLDPGVLAGAAAALALIVSAAAVAPARAALRVDPVVALRE